MLNTHAIQARRAAGFHSEFVQPLYDSYNFVHLPKTIQHLLTGLGQSALPPSVFEGLRDRYDAVILLYVDAFGWRFFEQFKDRSPALQHILQTGVASRITAQFPSTTAAHTTAIHTGLPPAQSGVYEWYIYEPKLDAIIAPLLFSYAGESKREQLKQVGFPPDALFPNKTIYQTLRDQGVSTHIYQKKDIAHTSPGSVLFSGATSVFGYDTLTEAFVNVSRRLQMAEQPSYYFVYYSPIDTIGHEYGPQSAEMEAEIDTFLMLLQRYLLERTLGKQKQRVLLLVTADHGQVEIDPKTTIFLNQAIPGFRNYIAHNRQGQLLVPAGSPRDLFLHIQPNKLIEAQQLLSNYLQGKAIVLPTSELIEQGYFGPPPISDALLKRVANLCVLPFKGESVYWYVKGKYEQRYYGHHGGLTPDEMEIPLLACEL